MSATVLVGQAEHLAALQTRDDLGQTIAFADTDAVRALEVITRRRPQVVAIERGFADTSRGTALIERIKADPALTACEILVVAHDSDYARVSPRHEADAGSTPVAAPLDQRGTRRTLRFKILEGVNAQIDGNTTSIVNLSVMGAEVVSRTILKPNQRVWFTLADTAQLKRWRAVVIWSAFEIPKGVGHYRVGLEFFDADQGSLARFIQTNKQ